MDGGCVIISLKIEVQIMDVFFIEVMALEPICDLVDPPLFRPVGT
jgi:hypothetical protein